MCGVVLGSIPVLQCLAGTECGCLVSMCGNMVITRGRDIGGVVQALQGVTQVRLKGSSV